MLFYTSTVESSDEPPANSQYHCQIAYHIEHIRINTVSQCICDHWPIIKVRHIFHKAQLLNLSRWKDQVAANTSDFLTKNCGKV